VVYFCSAPLVWFYSALDKGCFAFATDGRKSGEGHGEGTGVTVYFSLGVWNSTYSDEEVQS
jgi:hypothetical protein